MTREAINELKKYTLGRKNTEKVEISVLQINRIIKALEQQPCEACCISRNDMLDAIGHGTTYTSEELQRIIKGLPLVLPKQRWIPVSERLPNNDEDVLVCYLQNGMEVCYYHIDDTFYPTEYEDLNETGWFNENGDAVYFEPIAWMPLPEPYKASPTEEEI